MWPLDHQPLQPFRIVHIEQPTTNLLPYQTKVLQSLRPIFSPKRNRFGCANKASPLSTFVISYANNSYYAIIPPKRVTRPGAPAGSFGLASAAFRAGAGADGTMRGGRRPVDSKRKMPQGVLSRPRRMCREGCRRRLTYCLR